MGVMFRQGDVLIERVAKMPAAKGLKKVLPDARGRIVLAEGEATGHAHTLHHSTVRDAFASPNELFLRVGPDAAVTHDEHDSIELDPGIYRVTRQREYSPEAIRNVAD